MTGYGSNWRRGALAALCAAGVLPATRAAAQQFTPQTNPGQVSRENQRTIRSLSELRDVPALSGPAVTGGANPTPTQVPPGGPTFVLKAVQFTHSALLPQAEVEALATPLIGKRIDLSALYKLVAAIDALYAKQGFVNASAVLPPQHVSDGHVRIELVEGKLGATKVEGNAYVPGDFVLNRLPLAPGEVVNVPTLSSNIATFNRLNDIQVRASLQPGAQFGQTDITLTTIEPPRDALDLTFDNWGIDSTGRLEGAALYRRRTLMIADDNLALYVIGNTGDISGSAAYDVPVGSYGGRLGANFADTQTRVLYGPYQSLDITGRSITGGAHITQPFFANENWLIAGVLSFTTLDTVNRQANVLQTTDDTNKAGPGATISYVDQTTVAEASAQYARGGTEFHAINEFDTFDLFSGTYRLQHAFPLGFSANVSGAWQYTPTSILSPDQLITLGGATSVRGYDANLVAGFSGIYEQFEVHKELGSFVKGLDVYGLLDAGTVASPNTTRRTLVGAGIGSSYTFEKWGTFELDAAWPLERVVANQSNFELYFRLVLHAI